MERLSGVLFGMFRGSERHGPWVVACLQGAWAPLVGPQLAAVCAPVGWDAGRLLVEVRDAAWLEALEELRPELLEKVRAATSGEVRRLDLRLPPPPASDPGTGRP